MTKLRCVVERITYQNAENGYSVMKVKVKGYDDLVTLVGNLLEVPAGSVLLCEGEWRVDKRYGQQFQCQTWRRCNSSPTTLSITVISPWGNVWAMRLQTASSYFAIDKTNCRRNY